ncbi:sodium:proton antiporter [Wukongibacter sp. M2B1]|uniref:sodium:proton antiporter n=1 Tax=Wukongibacter sp. M2B1 TaxID=3088895 RepID=UPI003D797BE6
MSLLLSFIIVLIGIYGLTTSENIIKSVVCLNITQTAVILLFLNFGNLNDGNIPIIDNSILKIVDPLPQALMITAIVIGASITSLALIISIKIFHYYGTLNWKKLLEREG